MSHTGESRLGFVVQSGVRRAVGNAWWGLGIVATLWSAGVTAATPSPSDAASGDAGEDSGATRIRLSLLEQYRLRIVSNVLPDSSPLAETAAADQKTDQQLRLMADGEVSAYDDHLLGVAQGELWWDLDGAEPAGNPDLFATETSYQQPWFTPYALSVEWRDEQLLDHARVGRQASQHGLPLTFDGASVGLSPLGRSLLLFGFGGRTVHFFESDPGLFEDWVASLGGVVRPTPSLKIELDSRLIRERVFNAETEQTNRGTFHSYGVTASARDETLFGSARLRGIDRQLSHGGVAFASEFPSIDLGLSAKVEAQFVTLNEIAESEQPFFSILGRSLPHARFRFDAVKRFELGDPTSLSINLGWRGRQLLGQDEERFNRNSGGLYLDARLDDLLQRGWFVDGTAEYLYVPGAWDRERLLAVGGAAGYRGKRLRSELGTYYQQFKVTYYERAEELLDTRTIYGSLGYQVFPWLEVRGRYEFEILDRYLQSFFISLRQEL